MKKLKKKDSKKSIGFYVGMLACIVTIINLIAYNSVPFDIYKMEATLWAFGGIALFLLFSVFKRTAELAPISLMVGDFMALLAFVQAPGTIDYFSTQFFGGFSMEAVFALPTAVWLSILTFIASFVISSIAMYLPQYKKLKEAKVKEK